MKKIATLAIVAALICGVTTSAYAVDFKIRGIWQFAFDYADGGNFMGKTRTGANVPGQQWNSFHVPRDSFWAGERVNLQLEAIASENLSGVVNLEIGDMAFGDAKVGGALGADSTNIIRVKNAYLDWVVPNTDMKLRMGIQSVAMPGLAFSTMVFDSDVAGIVASYKFNSNVALTGMWLRPYNDNWGGKGATGSGGFASSSPAGFMDNFDLAALTLPITMDGVKIIPWAMGGAYGPNVQRPAVNAANPDGNFISNAPVPNSMNFANVSTQMGDNLFFRAGMLPSAFSSSKDKTRVFSSDYTIFGWGGLSLETTTLSPWHFAADFAYGTAQSDRTYLNRSGWYGVALGEYTAGWGTPGLYAWYYSGEDDDPNNGSERMPTLTTANHYFNCLSSFGFRGTASVGGGKGVLGGAPDGMWGVGARIKDMSFIDNISHVLRVHYFGGTNNTKMASYITGRQSSDASGRQVYRNYTDFNSPVGVYMTTADTGMEVNFDTKWKIYDNLSIIAELGYIHLWLDKDVWGKYGNVPGDSLNYKDAWKATVNILYMF